MVFNLFSVFCFWPNNSHSIVTPLLMMRRLQDSYIPQTAKKPVFVDSATLLSLQRFAKVSHCVT